MPPIAIALLIAGGVVLALRAFEKQSIKLPTPGDYAPSGGSRESASLTGITRAAPDGEANYLAATAAAHDVLADIPHVPAGSALDSPPLGELPTPLQSGDDPVPEPENPANEIRVVSLPVAAVVTSLADAFPNA